MLTAADLERTGVELNVEPRAPAREQGRAELDGVRRTLERDQSHDGLHVTAQRGAVRELATHALLSSARHELRSPLQSIQGFAELLAAESYGTLGKDQRVFVEHILQSTSDLSRTLDACFDLIQVELLHLPSAPTRVKLSDALGAALTLAQGGSERPIEARLGQLDPGLQAELDTLTFCKAIASIVTAIGPLLRTPVVLTARQRDANAELLFGVDGDDRGVFRELRETTRRGNSSRALLWLRLSAALLDKSSVRLETVDDYERIRVLVPLAQADEQRS
jgi:signal transduction histidine kinase